MSRNHEKLQTFHLADELAIRVYRETINFPASERHGLQSQIRRAAVSVPTNIVEGCARRSENDYLRFLDIALSSANETDYLLDLCFRLSIFTDDGYQRCKKCSRSDGSIASKIARFVRFILGPEPGARSPGPEPGARVHRRISHP